MQAVSRPLFLRAVGRRPTVPGAPFVVWGPAVLIAAAMLLPLVYLLVRSAGASAEAWDLLFRANTAQTFGRTALLIAAVTLGSAAIAIPLAWLTVRTDLPLRGAWSVLTVLPLVIPSYVGLSCSSRCSAPAGCSSRRWGRSASTGSRRSTDFPARPLTLVLLSYPYLLLVMRGAWANLDPATEDSARSLGHGSWSTMLRVTLPPASARDRGRLAARRAVHAERLRRRPRLMEYPTFTWVIFQQDESAFDRSIASVLSLVVVGTRWSSC